MTTSRLLLRWFLLAGPATVTMAQPTMLTSTKAQTRVPIVNLRNASDSLQAYVGTYEITSAQRLTISLAGEKLYILPPGEDAKTELKQISETKFDVVGETAHLLFKKNAAGQVWQVELQFGNGASATAKKR